MIISKTIKRKFASGAAVSVLAGAGLFHNGSLCRADTASAIVAPVQSQTPLNSAIASPASPPTPGQALTLDEAVQAAVARQQARQRLIVDQAESAVGSAEAARLPTLVTVLRADTVSNADTGVAVGSGELFYGERSVAGIEATAPIYDAGLTKDRVTAARDLLDSASSTSKSGELLVADAVTTAYYTALNAQAAVAVGDDQLTAAQARLSDAQSRQIAGAMTTGDVLTAQSAEGAAAANVQQLEYVFTQARTQLALLMGTDPANAAFSLVAPPSQSPVAEQTPDLIAQTLSHDPARQHLNDILSASEAGLRAVHAEYQPSLHLFAGGGYASRQAAINASVLTNGFYADAGVAITAPIFANREQRAAERDAKDEIALDKLDIADYDNAIRQGLVNSDSEYEADSSLVTADTEEVAAAAEALRLAKQQYLDGNGTQLAVTVAQSNLTAAQDALTAATFNADMVASSIRLRTTGVIGTIPQ